MSDYIISCCSTADLAKEHFDKRNITYICFHYELDGKEYADDLGESMPFDKFYKAMQDGAMTKTSQVNAEEFEKYFEKIPETGKRYSSCVSVLRNFRCDQFRYDRQGQSAGEVSGQEDPCGGFPWGILRLWTSDGSSCRSS